MNSVEAATKELNDIVKGKGILGQKPNYNVKAECQSPKSSASQRSTAQRVLNNKSRVATEQMKRSVVRQDRTVPIITTNQFDCRSTCESS